MSWRRNTADWIADMLRLLVLAGLLIDGVILAFFSVWFTWRACGRLMDVLSHWLFTAAPRT